jgi:hypothetical protein
MKPEIASVSDARKRALRRATSYGLQPLLAVPEILIPFVGRHAIAVGGPDPDVVATPASHGADQDPRYE